MKEFEISFRNNLIHFLDENGWDKKKLAERTGLSNAAVSKYVNGSRAPGVDSIVKIARVCGTTVENMIRERSETVVKYNKIEKIRCKEIVDLFAPHKTVAVFDTETTGLDGENDRIIEFAAQIYEISDDCELLKIGAVQFYIKPGFALPPIITRITGLTNEFLSTALPEDAIDEFGMNAADKVQKILTSVDVCVAHNLPFDKRFVEALMRRGAKPSPFERANCCADTLAMARELLSKDVVPNHKNQTLVNMLCPDHNITSFHNALDDACATGMILQKFIDEYRKQYYTV